ncbi:fructose-1, 6-bisphosphatase/inositol-1-monophosphatase [Paraliobacillus ryukyuensis]|uniref:inositol-phosphate phosphatase n=1 Tax=Paraliobacillus ryukyuensis TaxID=200904 RepID=A0A366EIV8_9BACI|nr:inositol monophosphatase family protein [Paraliobacillus ryukyuensis]RBP01926.1 myo-inositol-1(or 4)-monophosphatase [Paraliobacillus ryukyuensis]
MEKKHRNELYTIAKQWVLDAGRMIRESLDKPLTIETKSNPNDLVTEMDQKTEQFFAKKIKSYFPDHKILSEEGFGDELASLDGTVWIIDPIDGTMNFVHQKRNFAISLAIYHDGIGQIGLIYNVMEDVLYHVKTGEGAYRNDTKLQLLKEDITLERTILLINSIWSGENRRINHLKIQQLVRKVRGTRSYGSAALEFAGIAEGSLDAYISMKLHPWDFAAGVLLVNEVGGTTSQIDGKPLNFLTENTIFSGNKQVANPIIDEYIELK